MNNKGLLFWLPKFIARGQEGGQEKGRKSGLTSCRQTGNLSSLFYIVLCEK
jgi:hypothetical protein